MSTLLSAGVVRGGWVTAHSGGEAACGGQCWWQWWWPVLLYTLLLQLLVQGSQSEAHVLVYAPISSAGLGFQEEASERPAAQGGGPVLIPPIFAPCEYLSNLPLLSFHDISASLVIHSEACFHFKPCCWVFWGRAEEWMGCSGTLGGWVRPKQGCWLPNYKLRIWPPIVSVH